MSRRKQRLAVALAAAVFAAVGFGAGSPFAPVADAAAATSIQGTVSLNGARVAGATVTVLRWSGAQWVSTGVRSSTSSTGQYFIGGLSNWYTYTVEAYKPANHCYPLGYFDVYLGYAQPLYAQGGARGANIAISFNRSVSCYP
jgi:hypothetical protein